MEDVWKNLYFKADIIYAGFYQSILNDDIINSHAHKSYIITCYVMEFSLKAKKFCIYYLRYLNLRGYINFT